MAHHVFVYGTLKRGFANDWFLERARLLGEARTEARYTMRSLGEFPGVIEGGETAITGEVYEVSDEQLARIDQLEGHPDFYRRQMITVSGIRVLAYLLPINYFESAQVDFPVIENGVWS